MRITVNEAADMLERSPEFIRMALQQKALPIGIAIRMHESTRYTYYINPPDLARYMNITLKELEKRKERLHRFEEKSAQWDQ